MLGIVLVVVLGIRVKMFAEEGSKFVMEEGISVGNVGGLGGVDGKDGEEEEEDDKEGLPPKIADKEEILCVNKDEFGRKEKRDVEEGPERVCLLLLAPSALLVCLY